MDSQGSPCCHVFLAVTPSYHSKVTPFGVSHKEKLAAAILLHVFRKAFSVSLFRERLIHFSNTLWQRCNRPVWLWRNVLDLVFNSGSTQFFGVKFFVWNDAYRNIVTFKCLRFLHLPNTPLALLSIKVSICICICICQPPISPCQPCQHMPQCNLPKWAKLQQIQYFAKK